MAGSVEHRVVPHVAVGATIEGLLCLTVAFAALAYGAVELWAEAILHILIAVLIVLLAVRRRFGGHPWPRPGPMAVAVVLALGLLYFQSISLGPRLLNTLSPNTAALYEQVTPVRTERLVTDAPSSTSAVARPSTLSLYPFGTRVDLHRLAAYAALFFVAMSYLNTPARVRRFCVFLAVFGGALALFALVQRLTWDGRIYWTRPVSDGAVMGPFVCRNHYAGFVNLCIGAAFGLILSRLVDAEWWDREARRPNGAALSDRRTVVTFLLIGAAGLMMASVFYCLSRGGMMALALTGLGAFGLLAFRDRRVSGAQRVGILLILLVGGGLLVWFGSESVYARLATLTHGLDWHWQYSGRLRLWADLLAGVQFSPLWGVGAGAHEFVHPLFATYDWQSSFIHGENEYVQTLVETGVVGLVLLAAVLAVPLLRGVRYVLAAERDTDRMLAIGLLFGLTTMVIHNLCDFHFRIPSNAALFTIMAGGLCGLWWRRRTSRSAEKGATDAVAGGGARTVAASLPLAAAAVAGILIAGDAMVDLRAGLRWQHVRRIEDTLAGADGPKADLAGQRRLLAALARAIEARPEEAHWRWRAAREHLRAYGMWVTTTLQAQTDAGAEPSERTQRLVSTLYGLGRLVRANADNAPNMAGWLRVWPGCREHLVPAAREFQATRAACPLIAKVHVGLAELWFVFENGSEMMWRCCAAAQRTGPAKSRVWFDTGALAYLAERRSTAWAWWRRSVLASDRYLEDIARYAVSEGLDAEAFLRRVAIPDPRNLHLLAHRVYTKPGHEPSHRFLLDQTILQIGQIPAARRSPRQLLTLARACREAGLKRRACSVYSDALLLSPNDDQLRYEYALILCDLGQWSEAQTEAWILHSARPLSKRYAALLKRTSEAAQNSAGAGGRAFRPAPWPERTQPVLVQTQAP